MGISDEVRGSMLALRDFESEIREDARKHLHELWPSHMDEIVGALDSSDVEVRRAAVSAVDELGKIVLKSRPKVEERLLQALDDPDIWVRYNACSAVLTFCIDNERCIALLCKCTIDPQWNVRQAAIDALGEIGRADANIISSIIDRSTDVHENVRFFVPDALTQLGMWNAAVEACLQRMLQDEEGDVRARAIYAVRKLSPGNDHERLLECVRNDRAYDVREALEGVFDDAEVN